MFGRKAALASRGGVTVELKAKGGRPFLSLPYIEKGKGVTYSGLLTAAIRLLKEGRSLADICFSIQEVSFAMLAEAVERSLVQTRKKEVLLAGGVAANKRLREMIQLVAEDHGATFHPVPIEYSGDCGAQIACSGRLAFESGITVPVPESFVNPRWRLDEIQVPWIPRP